MGLRQLATSQMTTVFFIILTIICSENVAAQLTTSLPPVASTTAHPGVIRVGLLFVRDDPSLEQMLGYDQSAGALLVAEDRIRKEHLLDGYQFEYLIRFDNCIEALSVGLAVDLIVNAGVDVIIGPTCNDPAISTSILASYYDVPIFPWGLTTSYTLDSLARFPTAVTLMPNMHDLGVALLTVFENFGWNEFSFINSNAGAQCPVFKGDLQTAITENNNDIVMVYSAEFFDSSSNTLKSMLNAVKQRARIIVVCVADGSSFSRDVMLAAYDSDMVNDEYVYIFPSMTSLGYEEVESDGEQRPIWEKEGTPDGRDEEARTAFTHTLVVLLESTSHTQEYEAFGEKVIEKMADPPFNCENCTGPVSLFAGYLHDAFYVYANAINRSVTQDNSSLRNGSAMLINAAGDYVGINGNITITASGGVTPNFKLGGLSANFEQETYWMVFPDTKTVDKQGVSEAQIFNHYASGKPSDTPKCGFTGLSCPVNLFEEYKGWFIAGIVVVILTVMFALIGLVFVIRARAAEKARLNMLWKVLYIELEQIKAQSKAGSSMSLQSSNSGSKSEWSRNISVDTKLSGVGGKCKFYRYQKDIIMGVEHPLSVRIENKEAVHLRKMRNLEHDNLNRFVGMVIDCPQPISLWRLCSRGSLSDVITRGSMPVDGFFIYSLLMDIVNGLHFIHHSFLQHHGALTSRVCLIDDRWQLKISLYGLTLLKPSGKEKDDLLWTAPEQLRGDYPLGSQPGDIYSLGIIASELLCKTTPWNLENRTETAEEVIYMVQKGLDPPMRPGLVLSPTLDISPSVVLLVRDCWDENRDRRPDTGVIRTMLKSINTGKQKNLMDHVMNTLEEHADNLEKEVDERMKELVEEKKKSDLLLYRMLPKQVADKLKVGQSVEPEGFDSVTIFFSDVVGFTSIASRCTPLQVETIGDGYLCVSGLPHRNGMQHINEICDMSLELNEALKGFQVPHLPDVRVQLRIGVHSGSVVAGVVGLTMPRYCLFGDTVNTASRMESSGKAAQIHISTDSNRLIQMTGLYATETRGEVIIKGKGVMETFWLLGRKDGIINLPKPSKPKTPPVRAQVRAQEPDIMQASKEPVIRQARSDSSLSETTTMPLQKGHELHRKHHHDNALYAEFVRSKHK